jgi:hypothetical protein
MARKKNTETPVTEDIQAQDVAKYEPSVEMPSTDPPTGQVE